MGREGIIDDRIISRVAITSLILGVLSLAASGVIGLLLFITTGTGEILAIKIIVFAPVCVSIASIVTGIVGFRHFESGESKGGYLAISGLVMGMLSIIGLTITIFLITLPHY